MNKKQASPSASLPTLLHTIPALHVYVCMQFYKCSQCTPRYHTQILPLLVTTVHGMISVSKSITFLTYIFLSHWCEALYSDSDSRDCESQSLGYIIWLQRGLEVEGSIFFPIKSSIGATVPHFMHYSYADWRVKLPAAPNPPTFFFFLNEESSLKVGKGVFPHKFPTPCEIKWCIPKDVYGIPGCIT